MVVLMGFSRSNEVHQLPNRIQEAQLHLPARIDDARDASDDSDFDEKENRTVSRSREGIRQPLYATTR
jgi:hypothetical protein